MADLGRCNPADGAIEIALGFANAISMQRTAVDV
jgi:hypothetical protein